MTNCSSFPKYRNNGICMKFGEYRYSWCENNPSQRKYLLESDYCNGAIEIYVWENDKTYNSVESFKDYLRNKKDEGACPICGRPLKIRKSHADSSNVFLGCVGWPECKYTKKA